STRREIARESSRPRGRLPARRREPLPLRGEDGEPRRADAPLRDARAPRRPLPRRREDAREARPAVPAPPPLTPTTGGLPRHATGSVLGSWLPPRPTMKVRSVRRGSLPGGFIDSRIWGRRGFQTPLAAADLAHDVLPDSGSDALRQLEGAGIGDDTDCLAGRVVKDLAGSAVGEGLFQHLAGLPPHVVVEQVRQLGDQVLAAKHWQPARGAGIGRREIHAA